MKHNKDELQNITIGNGQDGQVANSTKFKISLEEMRMQAQNLKNKSISKVKKNHS